MFIAANIGYMWGLALGIVSILLLWSQRGPNVDHGWVLWIAVVLSCVASIHHELNAPGIVGAIVAMALITPAGKWTTRWAGGSDRGGCGKCRENGNAGFVGTSSPASGRPIPVPRNQPGRFSQRVVIHRRLRQSFAQQLPGRVLCDHAVSHRYVSGSHEARIPPSRYRYPAHPVLCGRLSGWPRPACEFITVLAPTKARGRYSTGTSRPPEC